MSYETHPSLHLSRTQAPLWLPHRTTPLVLRSSPTKTSIHTCTTPLQHYRCRGRRRRRCCHLSSDHIAEAPPQRPVVVPRNTAGSYHPAHGRRVAARPGIATRPMLRTDCNMTDVSSSTLRQLGRRCKGPHDATLGRLIALIQRLATGRSLQKIGRSMRRAGHKQFMIQLSSATL